MRARGRRLSLRKRLLFAVLPLLGLLFAGEVVARVARDPWHLGSYRELRLDLQRRGYPAALDDHLGYVPRAGFRSSDNRWGVPVTIGADGLRSNGRPAPGSPPPGLRRGVIAVGDSFTFGDEVGDAETWPARLEQELGARVRNGGVFGYSVVQAALRGEQLVERYGADWLVLSFLPDDLRRNEFARRYTSVPWFDIVDGGLVLRNCPVERAVPPGEAAARRLKDALGHSALADALLAQAAPDWWFAQQKEVRNSLGWDQGRDVTILIVDRLAAFCAARDCRLLVVMQGSRTLPTADAVVAHARRAGVRTLDLVAEYRAVLARRPEVRGEWFRGHMTAAGNRWVAQRIAAALRDD